jgi:hypothetical protein
MLWALTNPLPEDRTDLGEIVPVIVLTNDNFVSAETTSLCAGVAMAQSEVINRIAIELRRMP